MRWLTNLSRVFAAIVLVLGAALVDAAPADAARRVPQNLTAISAVGYNAGAGDWIQATFSYDTAFHGKASIETGQLIITVTWKDSSGALISTAGPTTTPLYPRTESQYFYVQRPVGATQVQFTGTMRAWDKRTGIWDTIDNFDTGVRSCGGTWTPAVQLFYAADND